MAELGFGVLSCSKWVLFPLQQISFPACLKNLERKSWVSFYMGECFEKYEMSQKYQYYYSSFQVLLCPFCHFARIAFPYLRGTLFCSTQIPLQWRTCYFSSGWGCYQQPALRDASAVEGHLTQGHTPSWEPTSSDWLMQGYKGLAISA